MNRTDQAFGLPSPQSQPRAHTGGTPPRTVATGSALPGTATLADLPKGRPCTVLALRAGGMLGQRLADMGFCPGLRATVVRRAPLGDPLEVDLAGTRLCIRGAEAAQVEVSTLDATKSAHGGEEERP